MRHEFLAALEHQDCVGQTFGWLPRHLAVYRDDTLVGAAPLYLKDNSYGEFVFDWAWADAYRRHGLAYYPKLVSSIPYTPATGPRLLVDPGHERGPILDSLLEAARELARDHDVSSLHWLFTDPQMTQSLEQRGLMRRTGVQFHWHNAGYRDFDDFLAALTHKRRKQIRRERRQAADSGVHIEVLRGGEVSAEQWAIYHRLYRSTFERKSGIATLSQGFFMEVAERMPDSVLLLLARRGDHYMAGSLNFVGEECLYGRHWGCSETVPGLHFEMCYYRTIEFCIEQGLARFEAGAQGEHKLMRGFLPTPTYSAHWIAHPGFRDAIGEFLGREQAGIQDYLDELNEHSPFKSSPA